MIDGRMVRRSPDSSSRSTGKASGSPGVSFAAACDSSQASPGLWAPARRASSASVSPMKRASSLERFACLRARSIRVAGFAFRKVSRTLSSAASALALHATDADFALPETSSCGCLRAEAQNADQRASGTMPETWSLISATVSGLPKLASIQRTASEGSFSIRAASAEGSSTFFRRKWSGGSLVRFFSAETSDRGTFAPTTSTRITSSAGFISTSRPAPRPGMK